jgi:hypothetical protein
MTEAESGEFEVVLDRCIDLHMAGGHWRNAAPEGFDRIAELGDLMEMVNRLERAGRGLDRAPQMSAKKRIPGRVREWPLRSRRASLRRSLLLALPRFVPIQAWRNRSTGGAARLRGGRADPEAR